MKLVPIEFLALFEQNKISTKCRDHDMDGPHGVPRHGLAEVASP